MYSFCKLFFYKCNKIIQKLQFSFNYDYLETYNKKPLKDSWSIAHLATHLRHTWYCCHNLADLQPVQIKIIYKLLKMEN